MMTIVSLSQINQVFLNFRGDEVRYNFMSHLIDAFERHKIKFFVDKCELKGKDVKNLFVRIEESRIALVILSTRYAESIWCMDELAKIKKLADQEKLHVIPIFYKVEAQDVQKQTGKFGDYFWSLAKASSGNKIKQWKDALEWISKIIGLSLGEKRSEADFVKEIVKDIRRVIASFGLKEEEHRYVKHCRTKRRNPRNCNCEYELPDFKKSKTTKL